MPDPISIKCNVLADIRALFSIIHVKQSKIKIPSY